MDDDLPSREILEIMEPDGSEYFNNQGGFSHQGLVQGTYGKVIDAGVQEMRKGFWETKGDKFGNLLKIYHPDTRLAYINAVMTLLNLTISDQEEQDTTALQTYLDLMEKRKRDLADGEDKYYNTLPREMKSRLVHIKGLLNQDLPFYHEYVSYQVEVCREIFEQIELMLARNRYFAKRINTA